jgi:hypothetical protein
MSKRFLSFCVLCSVFCLLLSGCDTTPQERIAFLQNAVSQEQVVSNQLGGDVNALQVSIEQGRVFLADPNIDPNMLATINAALDKAQAGLIATITNKAKVDAMIVTWKQRIDALMKDPNSINLGNELGVYGQGISSIGTVLPPPYGTYAYLLGTIITGVGGYLARRKFVERPKVDEYKSNVTNIIQSVDALLKAIPKEAVPAAICALKSVQTPEVRYLVATTKSPKYNTAPN